jgi:hypothetical protein
LLLIKVEKKIVVFIYCTEQLNLDSFAEDLIPFPDMPNDKRVETFPDYVLSTYGWFSKKW